jgi:putative membrane protein
MTQRSTMTFAFIAVAFAATSGAQVPAKAVLADAAFMKDAAAAGMSEVELGQLAVERATRAEVKSFAQMLVDDHSKANDELIQLAQKRSVSLPDQPTPAQKETKNRLSKLTGSTFDDAYVTTMVKDHQGAVDLFTRESESGTDPEAKAWAAKLLPTLQAHHARATALDRGTKSPR